MTDDRASRRVALRRAAGIGSAVAVGGTVAIGRSDDASSAPSAATDRKILAYLLELEQLQAAFYDSAVRGGRLSGDVAAYARTVLAQEREHVDLLRKGAGAAAGDPARYDFGGAAAGDKAFLRSAPELEDLGLRAYNGAIARLTPKGRRDVVRLLSVEARHAAWIRDLKGDDPAPDASDAGSDEAAVRAAVKQTGWVR